MTLEQIKTAVMSGKTVYVRSLAYRVIVDRNNEWLILCTINGYCTGLTHADDVTMNAKPEEFFMDQSLIAEAVAPLKAGAQDAAARYAYAIAEQVAAKLTACNNDRDLFARFPSGNMSRAEYVKKESFYRLVRRLTTSRAAVRGMRDPDYADMNVEAIERFVAEARADAAFQYDAFVAKLEEKIGSVTAAKLGGNQVWAHSVLTVKTAAGIEQHWKTQQIINVSSLGKVFNQWPTRKMK